MGEGFLDVENAATVEVAPQQPEVSAEPVWPFRSVLEADVRALPANQLSELEGAIALAIAQLKLGLKVSTAASAAQSRAATPVNPPKAGGLVDMDTAHDPFPMGSRTPIPQEGEQRARIRTETGIIANVGVGEPPAANDKFEKIPELADVRLAAGDPIENHAEEQTGMIQFRKSFLKSVGADNGKALVVYAKGDSMEPVIRDGAALLVVPNESLTLRDLAAGGVYAINYDGKMIVKAVAKDRLTGRWVARSFNRSYDDIPLENGHPVRVLGQVVWAGARLRDDEAGQWIRS
ncbi:helix-turn-helix transcriptional regulator [Achromobacter sp. ACM03]|nr:helix-turn-helix transcriptional regulator [Achromobacter sp. ACM03]